MLKPKVGVFVTVFREATSKRSKAWALVSLPNVLTSLFALVGGLLIMRHDLWRDEAHPFLIARDSHSLRDLMAYIPYDGHPPLWYWILFLLTRMTHKPEAMQWLHLTLAATTVHLVVRFAPFPRFAKILFPFGYFTLFEYGIISRDYQLVFLFVVLFCVIYERNPTAYAQMGTVLFLLCLSHVLGTILAGVLSIMMLAETTMISAGRLAARKHRWPFLAGTIVAASGAALSVLAVIPPPNAIFLTGWSWDLSGNHIHHTLSAVWNAYVPIAPRSEDFWNGTILPEDLRVRFGVGIGIVVALSLASSWRAFVFLVLGQFSVLLFLHVKYFGYMRQHGTLFMAAVAAFWIAFVHERETGGPKTGRWAVVQRWLPRTVLITLLVVQVYAVLVPLYYSWRIQFSPGHAAARALLNEVRKDEPVVVTQDGTISALAAYAPGRTFFFPWGQRWGTFAMYRKEFNLKWLMADNGLWWAENMARGRNVSVMLVNPGPIVPLPDNVTPLGQYDKGIVGDERYFLYRVQPRAR